MTFKVPEQAISDYQCDGVVVLRQIITPEQVKELSRGIDFNLKFPGSCAKIASVESDTGRFFEDFCNWRRIPEFFNAVHYPNLGYAAATLMESRIARLHHDHTLVKEPKTLQSTPWHQDQPYYNIEGSQTISFWIPVDSVPLDSAMEFVAGSHKGPWYMPRTFRDQQARWFPEGTLEELPDEKQRAKMGIRSWAMEAGDAVCFNMLTLHASKGSKDMRRAFSVRFVGDDVIHAPRRWVTSPPFPGLEKQLPAGAPLDGPLFPIVYTRSRL